MNRPRSIAAAAFTLACTIVAAQALAAGLEESRSLLAIHRQGDVSGRAHRPSSITS